MGKCVCVLGVARKIWIWYYVSVFRFLLPSTTLEVYKGRKPYLFIQPVFPCNLLQLISNPLTVYSSVPQIVDWDLMSVGLWKTGSSRPGSYRPCS